LAHDVEVDEEHGLLVAVLGEVLLDPGEVEADFRVGIEGELRLGPELLYRGGSGHRGLDDGVEGNSGQRSAGRRAGHAGPEFLAPVMMTSFAGIRKNLREV
jgi:hypothetical protein